MDAPARPTRWAEGGEPRQLSRDAARLTPRSGPGPVNSRMVIARRRSWTCCSAGRISCVRSRAEGRAHSPVTRRSAAPASMPRIGHPLREPGGYRVGGCFDAMARRVGHEWACPRASDRNRPAVVCGHRSTRVQLSTSLTKNVPAAHAEAALNDENSAPRPRLRAASRPSFP